MQTPPKSSPNKSMSNNVSSLDMTNVINQVISKQEAQNGSITSDNENNDNITSNSGNIQLKIEDVAKILESGQKGSVIISKEDISKLFSSTLSSNSQNNNNRSDNQKETSNSYSSSQKILDEFNADSPTSHSMFPTLTPMESHVDNQDSNDPNQNNNSDWSFEEQFKPLYQIDNDPLRKPFLNDLFAFMHQKGQPINRIPIMAKQILDLYTLYKLVVSKGGLVEVIQKKIWREITKGLNLPNSITSAAFTLRTQYMKYLYPYECAKEKLSNDSELNSAIEGNKRDNKVGKSVSYPHHGQGHESYDTNISFHHKNSTPSGHNYHNDSGISERSFHNRHNLQSNNNDRKSHFPPLEKFTPIATPSSSGNMIIDRIDQNDSLNHLKNVLGLTTNQSQGNQSSSSHNKRTSNSVNQISPGKVSLSPSTLENLSTVAAAVLCATQSKNSDRALTSDNLVAFEALAKLKRSVDKSNENTNTNNQSNLTSPTSRIAPIQINNNHHNNLKRKIENDYTEKTSKLLKIANNQSNSTNTNNSDSVYNENNNQLTPTLAAPASNNFNFNFSDLSTNKSITASITINGVVYEGELKPKSEEGEQNLNQTQIIAKQLLLENLKK